MHKSDYGKLNEKTKMHVADRRGPKASYPASRPDPGPGKSRRLNGLRNPKQGGKKMTTNPFPEN
jgi:hypothetical protein